MTGDKQQFWRGYKIGTANGGVLLRDANVDEAIQNVGFVFVARKKGAETVTIKLFDSNLNIEEKEFSVNVS